MQTARIRDPGLQGERTALAWSRTGLAVLVNGLVVLRSGLLHESKFVGGLGVALLFAAVGVALYGAHRKKQLTAAMPVSAPSAAALAALTSVAIVTSLAALPVIWSAI